MPKWKKSASQQVTKNGFVRSKQRYRLKSADTTSSAGRVESTLIPSSSLPSQ